MVFWRHLKSRAEMAAVSIRTCNRSANLYIRIFPHSYSQLQLDTRVGHISVRLGFLQCLLKDRLNDIFIYKRILSVLGVACPDNIKSKWTQFSSSHSLSQQLPHRGMFRVCTVWVNQISGDNIPSFLISSTFNNLVMYIYLNKILKTATV